jgi:hypothetical protein
VAQEVLQQLKSVLPRIIPSSDEDVEIHEDEHSELALT